MTNISKYQQGGQANAQQAFIQWLAQVFQVQDEQQLQQLAQQLGEQGLQQMMQIFQQYPDPEQGRQVVQQMMQGQAQSAKRGAKLDYYRKVMGICKPGEKAVFMKRGGHVCKVCQAQEQPVKKDQCGAKLPRRFENGKRIQKSVKKDCGGSKLLRFQNGKQLKK